MKPNNLSTLIKNQISALDFFESELKIFSLVKNKEWIDGGLCPFHHDKNTGSFKINTVTGGFICFSCGESGGDIIKYVQTIYQLSFKDACKKIALEWGIQ